MRYQNTNDDDIAIDTYESPKKFSSWISPNFAKNKFTFYIICADIIIYLVCLLYEFIGQISYFCVLYNLGAAYTPAITIYYQWQRIIFPIFLHGGLAHLAMNMFSQLNLGFVLEDYLGTKKFIILYMVAGITGNLLSCAIHPYILSIGASGALFGLMALELIYLIENWERLGSNRNAYLRNYLIMLFINFAMAENSNVNTVAHIGGMIGGLLFSILYLKKPILDNIKLPTMKIIAGAILAILNLGLIAYIASLSNMDSAALSMKYQCS